MCSAGQRTSREEGQSPGVKAKMPLHVVHSVQLKPQQPQQQLSYRSLRVYVIRPARGWGISLWQVDVFGREDVAS